LNLDTAKIRSLLVKACPGADQRRVGVSETGEPAITTIALMEVLDAIIKAAILPMVSSIGGAGAPASAASGSSSANCRGPVVKPGLSGLKAVLATAAKTAVIFDPNLWPSRAANRTTLNGAFTAGVRAATFYCKFGGRH
jgi:hypothetical protein